MRNGADRIHFEGVLGRGRRLPPGRYRLVLSARDAAGNTSAKHTAAFTIVSR
jgi:hypothetical protein